MPNRNNKPARTPVCHPNRKHLAKGLCRQCYERIRGITHREELNKNSRRWATANREKIKIMKRKARYGLHEATFRARLNAQDGVCKICAVASATDVDHDHATGRSRGILCGNCNRALGLFRESVDSLRRAIRYLRLWDDRAVTVEKNTGRQLAPSTRGLS